MPHSFSNKFLLPVQEEIAAILKDIDDAPADELINAITSAKRVYLAGVGRSGLVASCFAMRLVHLGLVAHVVGEVTAPALGDGDLLLCISGSGSTRTIVAQARAAKNRNAKVAAIVACAGSNLAELADTVMEIHAPPYSTKSSVKETIQPGGSLFEQSALVFVDGLVLDMANRLDCSFDMFKERHSNLD